MAFLAAENEIDNWKICHRPIVAVYLKDFFCRYGPSQQLRILCIENYAHCFVFVVF